MKQNLRLILMTLLCAVFSTAWGETTLDFSDSDFLNNLGIDLPNQGSGTNLGTDNYTYDGITFSFTDGGTPTRIWNSSGKYSLRLYKNNNGDNGTMTISSSDNITQIVINGGNSLTSNVGSFSGETWTGSSKSVVFTATANSTITTITITTGSTQTGPTNPSVSFASNSLTMKVGETAENILTKPDDLTDVEFSNSNPDVATYNPSTGEVTAHADGKTTITASWEEVKDKYYGGSKSFTVTVNLVLNPNPKNFGSNYFVKVTSLNELEEGDAIIFVNEDDGKAMSTTQNPNNRGATSVDITDSSIEEISPNVQKVILTVKPNDESGAWYFYVNGENTGYLYAASSSNNYLKTKDVPDDNAKAEISFDDDDNAIIKFLGSNSRNFLRYNPNTTSGGNPLFSCYSETSSNQATTQIYKEIEKIEDVTITFAEAAAGYATLYYGDRNLTVPDGVKAYAFKIDDQGKGTKLTQYTVIPQGEGVLLELDVKSSLPVTKTFTVSETAGSKDSDNMLTGTDWEKTIVAADGYEYYKLATDANGGNVGFYYGAANGAAFKNAAHKAYLVAPVNGGSVSSYVFDDTNSIKSVNSTENNNSQVYTISGVRINGNDLPAGLYIVSGKKMIVK